MEDDDVDPQCEFCLEPAEDGCHQCEVHWCFHCRYEHQCPEDDVPDYGTNDPKGWCGDPSRGAALGRPTIKGEPEGTITVRLSPLDRQGYDRNGTYFGIGAPLFWIADTSGEVDYMDRFADLEDAVKVTGEDYPGIRVIPGEALKLKCWGAGDEVCPYGADADDDYGDQCEECYITEYDQENGEDEDE